MKKLALIIIVLIFAGCAAGALRISPEDIKSIQTRGENGSATNGCVSTNISATSGVVGGTGKVIVTWGTIEESIIEWCTGGK